MVTAPNDEPVITPVAEPADATTGLLLVHVPPVTASLNMVVVLMHTIGEPVMIGGGALTVIVLVTLQPIPGV
jgi:hypothetical protein